MVEKLDDEYPGYVQKLMVTRDDLITQLSNNACLVTGKILASQNRKRLAADLDHKFNNKYIQKLSNDGVRFNPYF